MAKRKNKEEPEIVKSKQVDVMLESEPITPVLDGNSKRLEVLETDRQDLIDLQNNFRVLTDDFRNHLRFHNPKLVPAFEVTEKTCKAFKDLFDSQIGDDILRAILHQSTFVRNGYDVLDIYLNNTSYVFYTKVNASLEVIEPMLKKAFPGMHSCKIKNKKYDPKNENGEFNE